VPASDQTVDHDAIVADLREIALRTAALGKNRYAGKAFHEAARTIEGLRPDRKTILHPGALEKLQAIGKSTAAEIRQLVRDGRSERLEELRRIPSAVLEMGAVDGIGTAEAVRLFEEEGVDGIDALMRRLQEEGAAELGLSVDRVREALEQYEKEPPAHRLPVALPIAMAIVRHFARAGVKAEVVGAARRLEEAVPALELAVDTDPARAELILESHPRIARIVSADGETPVRARAMDGFPIAVHSPEGRSWGRLIAETTGPAEYVATLGDAEGADELALHAAAGIQWVPPERRDDPSRPEGEILIEERDLKGMIHCHTLYSDGKQTIEAMARAAEARGFQYLTITDHSQTAHYAKGLEVDEMKRQWDEVDRVQEKVGIRLLKGIESDILKDGSLDYEDEIIERLDVLIASIHRRHKLDEDAMTARIVKALRHPCFKIWGHPLGRLILGRAPVPCRLEEILDVAAEERCAIEINGDPHRMDLPPAQVRAARDRGIPFVVSSDAHSTRTLHYTRWGIAVARRGGLGPEAVLNTLGADDFAERVRPYH
jgi:DNA polymerase (family 10)